jgi:hypothetical protein
MVFAASRAAWIWAGPKKPAKEKDVKKSVLTIVLAAVSALALSQTTAFAKSSKGHTTKTSASKTHHKKHMHKG